MSAASVPPRSSGELVPAGVPSLGRGGRWVRIMPVALLGGMLAAGCGHAPPPAKDKKVEVVVTTPITDEVLDYQDFTGRMDAFRTVDLRARVTGYVDDAPFTEGDRVKKGEVLFKIDPRTYQAKVDQAAADLETKKAMTVKAEALYRRSMRLVPKASSQEDIENQRADWEMARAAVGLAEAKLREARLNLDFCQVISPINGRISRRFVDPGNLVKADDTMLTTLVSDDTVYAYFDVDERTYLDLVGENSTSTSSSRVKELKLPVLMRLANSEEFTYPGVVDFLDNRINGNTGSIRMRAVFPNPRDTFKSGLFVRIRLPVGSSYRAVLIPGEALQSDQGKKYVFVVTTVTEKKDDGTEEKKDIVEYRPVTIGQAVQKLRVINPAVRDPQGKVVEGLVEGERVIISGMQRVRAGAVVQVKEEPPPKPPGSPLLKLLDKSEIRNPKPEGNSKSEIQSKQGI